MEENRQFLSDVLICGNMEVNVWGNFEVECVRISTQMPVLSDIELNAL